MRIFIIVICALGMLLMACDEQVAPNAPDTTPHDTVKDGYSIAYRFVSSDSLQVEFVFTDADSELNPNIAIQFGDSTISELLIGDTVLSHRYPMRLAYTVSLVGRYQEGEPWKEVKSFSIDLRGWHPSVEQLLSCKRIGLKIKGVLESYDNWLSTKFHYDSIAATCDLSELGGPALTKDENRAWEDDYARYGTEDKVSIVLLNEGAKLNAMIDYFNEYYEHSGGYGERKRIHLNFSDISFTKQDSNRYIYSTSGRLAVSRLGASRDFESRFGSLHEWLVTDSVAPVGEVIFYK
jgi:hypothetical protein